MENKKVAVIYCRISETEDSNNNCGMSTQEKECREYAKNHNLHVAAACTEIGTDRRSRQRALQQLFGFCSNKEYGIQVVITKNPKQLSKNRQDLINIRLFFKWNNIEVHFIDSGEDHKAGTSTLF